MDSTVILLTGGAAERPFDAPLPLADVVIAADSGLELASVIGVEVNVVVGDMDSVDPDVLAAAEAAGAEIRRYSTDKDETDLELALAEAVRRGAGQIVVVGGAGGRLDHLLANAMALTSPALAGTEVQWWTGPYRATVVRHATELNGAPGDLVSLIPFGGSAHVGSTTGLRWNLSDETLAHGSSRGVSNEMTATTARIDVTSGTLLAIHRRTP